MADPIRICDRNGQPIADSCAGQGKLLQWMYGSASGRMVLKVMTKPLVSYLSGCVLNHPLSTLAIPFCICSMRIPMEEYVQQKYRSFNAFFTRQIKPEKRPIVSNEDVLISPCDAKLTVLPVTEDARFWIKGRDYSLSELLRCGKLAQRFRGGHCLIFRLTPDDFHHYCYPDDCRIGGHRRIEGELHTVNPISAEYVNVYHENTREITMLHTAHFGDILQIEVGAMMVGKIVNLPHGKDGKRGMEKGYFEFGGSTVMLILEPGQVQIDEQLIRNSEQGMETKVRYGERIGRLLS